MTTIEKLYPAIRGHRITTDSRQIIRGDIFIALKGENFDGNRYAAAALEQGAALAIIDNADYLSPDCELVADSLLFLQQLAHYHRKQFKIPVRKVGNKKLYFVAEVKNCIVTALRLWKE